MPTLAVEDQHVIAIILDGQKYDVVEGTFQHRGNLFLAQLGEGKGWIEGDDRHLSAVVGCVIPEALRASIEQARKARFK